MSSLPLERPVFLTHDFQFLCLKTTEWGRKKPWGLYNLHLGHWLSWLWLQTSSLQKNPTRPTLLCSTTSSCYLHSFLSTQTADIEWLQSKGISREKKKSLTNTTVKKCNFLKTCLDTTLSKMLERTLLEQRGGTRLPQWPLPTRLLLCDPVITGF